MVDYQAVFERHEKKYLLTKQQYKELRIFLTNYMNRDEYGLHTICSLYYDTDSYDSIRKSIEKPVYKEKLRLRSYGVPAKEDNVYLELKKKFKGIVYKRRVSLTYAQAERYMKSGIRPADTGQIFDEVDWYVGRNQPTPKVILCCDRLALFGKDDHSFRITFDFKIRWRDYDLDLTKGDYGVYLISPDLCLMEVKTGQAIPIWLAAYFSENKIFSTPFSKYGTCYKENLIEKGGISHVG